MAQALVVEMPAHLQRKSVARECGNSFWGSQLQFFLCCPCMAGALCLFGLNTCASKYLGLRCYCCPTLSDCENSSA